MSYLVNELSQRAQEAEMKLASLQESLDRLEMKYKKEDLQGIELYYWGLKNRGNLVQMLLVEANVDYKLITDGKEISQKCKCKNVMKDSALRFDPFAPPFIYHKGRMISQSMPMMMYVAELTGLRPKSNLDNVMAAMICENASDSWTEFIRLMDKGEEAVSKQLHGRLQHYLDILEKPLHHGNAKCDFYFENRITYADIAVVNVLDGLHELFVDGLYDELVTKTHPNLEALYQRVTQRKNIKALLDKQNKDGMTWFPHEMCAPFLAIVAGIAKKLKSGDAKGKDGKDDDVSATTQKPVAA